MSPATIVCRIFQIGKSHPPNQNTSSVRTLHGLRSIEVESTIQLLKFTMIELSRLEIKQLTDQITGLKNILIMISRTI
ncbi:hypothetical protein D3C79_1027430 [compost metagenome]